MRMFGWILLALVTANTALTGLALSSPSVVVGRGFLLWFGCLALVNALVLGWSLQGGWKVFAILLMAYAFWCMVTGWSHEVSRFQLGGGGTWFSGIGVPSILQILIPLVPGFLLWKFKKTNKAGCHKS